MKKILQLLAAVLVAAATFAAHAQQGARIGLVLGGGGARGGAHLGVLEVLARPSGAFTLAEMNLLGLFANQAAIALDLLQRGRRALGALNGDGELDLTIFEGASSGLLDAGDVADAGAVIEPGSSAGVLIYENRWAAPFTAALRRSGAQLVAAGFIPLDDIAAALDATESVG